MTFEPNPIKPMAATCRPVIADDLDLICRHRHEMFKASGRTDAMVQPSTDAFKHWRGLYHLSFSQQRNEPPNLADPTLPVSR